MSSSILLTSTINVKVCKNEWIGEYLLGYLFTLLFHVKSIKQVETQLRM